MKCFIVKLIIGATGIVIKGQKNLETIPGKRSVGSLPKKIQLY
jgi:hypothetical protein